MKLIKRTYLETFFWLIPVLLIGSVFSFYMIKYIVYEETDEFLSYEMDRLVKYHEKHNDLPEYYKVAAIIEDLKLDKPSFKDTLILEEHDNEMIPHRELMFSINHDDRDFTLVLRQLLPGNDDILEGSFILMIGLLLLILAFLFFMIKSVSKKLWKPFYETLSTLSKHNISEPAPLFSSSNIDEFNALNKVATDLLHKITDDYARTKEFNENASHELQTHLAIIRANAEKLLNSQHVKADDIQHLQQINNATAKLSTAQKSLLLLSKIGNLEFRNNERINLADITNQSLQLFDEAIAMRNISLTTQIDDCILHIDSGLLEIMINNLIKNAIKHNIQDGFIAIKLNYKELTVENSGYPFEGRAETLLNRFTVGPTGNIGLGLAIVKQICDVYHYNISYVIEANTHKIQVIFSNN